MIDLTDTLFKQRSIPRGDELLTHGSDVYGCLRATAYRRRGLTPSPYTPRELAKFAIGHGYERAVAETLRDAGHDVLHDPELFVVSAFGLDIIHPDIYLRDVNLLIEAKTTDGGAFYPKSDKARAGEPKEVSIHHALQVSLGAIALAEEAGVPVPQARVLVKHAGIGERGHEEIAHPVEPEDYRAVIAALAREVVEKTAPDLPLPPAEPPPLSVLPFDACGYCRWRQCARHPAHDPQNNEELVEIP